MEDTAPRERPDGRVTDCHVYVTNGEILALKEQLYSRGNQRLREMSRQRRLDIGASHPPHSDPAALAAAWGDELTRAGVDDAVVLCEAPTTRDIIHDIVASSEGRLRAFTNLDPLQTWSAEDLRKDVARGFVGLNLLPVLQHFHVYDRRAYGLYEMCEQLRVPVMVTFGLTDSIFADLRYANPLDLQPVARDFPEVAFIIPSLGSGFLRELFMLVGQCPNVFADTSGIHLWLRYQPENLSIEDVTTMLLDIAGPHRILFGTASGELSNTYREDILTLQQSLLASVAEHERAQIFSSTISGLCDAVDTAKASHKRASRLQLRSGGNRL